MTQVMLDRLQDKVATVRVQAARSLCRLQQPHFEDCPVIKGAQLAKLTEKFRSASGN